MSKKYTPKKHSDEKTVTVDDLNLSDDPKFQNVKYNTSIYSGKSAFFNFLKFEKGKITVTAIALIIIAVTAVIVTICVTQSETFAERNLDQVKVTQSKDYDDDMKTESDVESRLSDYDKSVDKDGYVTYKKDNIIIEVKYDNNNKIVYRRYENKLDSKHCAKVNDFNDSMIEIGMKKADVLKTLKGNNYVYNLSAKDENGDDLEIYKYGWNGESELLSLTFINGELSRYSINTHDIEGDISINDFEN